MSVAKTVRSLRKSADLSLDGLSGMSGASKSTLWNIEHGNCDPRASTLLAIADALGVHVGALFGQGGEPSLSAMEMRVIATMRAVQGGVQQGGDASPKRAALHPVPFCRECQKHVKLTAFAGGDELTCATCEGDDWYLDNATPEATEG